MDMLPLAEPLPDPEAFDYTAMDADAADEARAVVERYRGRSRAYVMDTGRDLLAMKARLGHGLFLAWTRAAMGLEPRTAQNFMQAAERFAGKSEIVSRLPPTVIYKLAAPSTPEPVRAAVLRRIEAGETIAPAAILDEVREAKEAEQARGKAEREAARRAALSDEAREEEDALRAKGEKGRAARERKGARERAAREEEHQKEKAKARKEEAEARASAVAFIDMVGADRLVAFFAQHRHGVAMVGNVMRERRARATPAVQVSPSDIFRLNALWGWLDDADRPRIEALAQEIERDGLKAAPVVVRREGSGSFQPWQILDGEDTFRALHDVLGWRQIPVHVVQPVAEADCALLGGVDV